MHNRGREGRGGGGGGGGEEREGGINSGRVYTMGDLEHSPIQFLLGERGEYRATTWSQISDT